MNPQDRRAVVVGVAALVLAGLAVTTAMGATAPSITADPTTAGATSTHLVTVQVNSGSSGVAGSSWTGFKVYYTASNASDVTQSSVKKIGFDTDDNDPGSTIDVNVTDDLSAVVHEDGGKTLHFDFGGNYNLGQGDELVLVYGDVGNAESAGDYSITLEINPQSEGKQADTTLSITEPTATPTATGSPTPSPTATPSPTPTATPSPTPTASATPTPTVSPTPTPTTTATPTPTPTVSPTPTPTATPTATPTDSATPIPSPTSAPTATATAPPSASTTATASPTGTATGTTAAPTVTESDTAPTDTNAAVATTAGPSATDGSTGTTGAAPATTEGDGSLGPVVALAALAALTLLAVRRE